MELGGYSIVWEIGRGGMGTVYRARSPEGRDVAIKLLLKAGSKEARERFDREQRLLASFGEAEGFVPLLGVGESPRGPFLVMPYLDGGTLRDKLRQGALDIAATCALGRTLAAALGRAHERGIVHRDMKPENILFTTDGRPLVADLGLAKHWKSDVPGASASVSLSKTGEARGTIGYMGPEQINDSKAVGPAADVFSLGAILYECLAGSSPFEGDSAHAVLARAAQGQFEPLRELRPEVPRWLERTVARALAPGLETRYRDGAALAQALAREGAGEPGRGPAVAGVVVVGAVSVLAAWLFLRPGAAPGKTSPPPPVASAPPAPQTPVAKPAPRPPAAPQFPAACKGYRRTSRTALAAIMTGHTKPVSGVAFTPDGSQVLSTSADGTFRIWDAATGSKVALLLGHEGAITSLSLSRDGRLALTGSIDGTARLWDVPGRRLLRTLVSNGRHVDLVACSPDGKRAVTTDASRTTIEVWDLATGQQLRQLEANASRFHSLSISPDGKYCLTAGGADCVVRIFNLDTAEVVQALQLDEVVLAGFARDGRYAVSWGPGVKIWDLGSPFADAPSLVASPKGHTGEVLAATFFPDGLRLLSTARDSAIVLWDRQGRELDRVTLGTDFAGRLAIDDDGRSFVAGTSTGAVLRFTLHAPDPR
jgi:hypothetical protein